VLNATWLQNRQMSVIFKTSLNDWIKNDIYKWRHYIKIDIFKWCDYIKKWHPLGSDVIKLRIDFFKCGCSPHKKVGNPKKLRSSVYINSGYKFRLAILIVNFSLETVEDSGWLHDFAFLTNCVQWMRTHYETNTTFLQNLMNLSDFGFQWLSWEIVNCSNCDCSKPVF
jgi:hypothetical protein